MNLLQTGLTRAFRGLRTGDPQLILLGAAILGYYWLKRSRPGREVLYTRTLKDGEGLTIKFDGEPV